jgi:multiple sugar transport system permease protein
MSTSTEHEALSRIVRRQLSPATVLAGAGMLVALVFFVLPLYWVIVSSMKDDGQLFSVNGLAVAMPIHLVSNLRTLFQIGEGSFGRWILNSGVYGITIAVGATFVAAMTGYSFAKFQFPLRRFWFFVLLGTITVPATALVLPIYLLTQRLGLINTYWGVIFPSLFSPFGVYLMRIFWTQGFPNEIIEAAYLDGANDWYIFTRLGLPMVSGGVATVSLVTFVSAWNRFFLPLVILSKTKLYPLTLGLEVWNSDIMGLGIPYSVIISGAMLSILPLILAYFFLQRYWQSGLMLGSYK